MQDVQEMIETIARALVDTPDAIQASSVVAEDGVRCYLVQAAPGEGGQLIGKEGRLSNAIRHLAYAAAKGKRVRVRILQPGEE